MVVRVTGQSRNLLLVAGGPAAHWIGPEMLVDLMIEGQNVNALADSGSQVNTIMPAFVWQYGFPVLPLVDLVNHLLNLVGLGRKCTSPLGFVILHVQVREIIRYDEDVVFLMVPDNSEFGHRVPLVIGTCTIGRIINVIRESEIDCLSTPWATVQMAQLLSCWKTTAVFIPGNAGEAQSEGASGGPQEVDVDELVTARECLPGSVSDRDHRGTGQTPLRGYSPFDDHATEGGGSPAAGSQATSGTPMFSTRTCVSRMEAAVSLEVRT